MLRDPNVVLMGEEIGKFEGSYKITGRPAPGVRREARRGHADRRGGVRRRGHRRGDARPAAGRRDHDDQLHPAGDRPDREPRRQDPLHVRRPVESADGDPHARGRRPAARGDALAELRELVRVRPGPEGGGAGHARRCARPAASRHPRRRPGHLPREPGALQHQGRGARPGRRSRTRMGTPRTRGADRHRR